MWRVVETFRAFAYCLTNPSEKGVLYGLGVDAPGEIEGMPVMQEAYQAGKTV
jgi:hypothetical protein